MLCKLLVFCSLPPSTTRQKAFYYQFIVSCQNHVSINLVLSSRYPRFPNQFFTFKHHLRPTLAHPSLYLLPPFQVRFRSVVSPFPRIGEKWDLQGNHIGITWELQQRQNRINLKKQNFYITLQLVTHSAINFSVSESCSGDSFHFTRHPLITLACVSS